VEGSYDVEDSAATAAVVENQRTAEWVQKIRGDEGSGLTLDRMRPPLKAADRTAGAGPGRFIPGYVLRRGGAVVGTENSGAEKEHRPPPDRGAAKDDPFVGQQAKLPSPQEDDAASSTVSFESCESPRTATTTSLESLLANSSGDGGSVAGKRWPSVSRIPLLAVGQSVSAGDRDDRNKNMISSKLLSLANSCDGAAPKGVRLYNSSVPQRGAVVANSTGKNEVADFSIAGGRLRVRSESPSR
jgi:hypothetical protein